MKNVSLLDCTLRDGGYVNDWEFGHHVITGTYKRLDEAGVDYIEVGFLDDRRPFGINRSIAPDTESFNKIFSGVEKKHAIPVAMIDFGTCGIEHIGDAEDSFIDGIRVIFKKEKIEQALPFCEQIKEKGYKLFIQAISITAYSDEDMRDYIQKINRIKPYAFSIVDTYGLLNEETLSGYFRLLDENLDEEIKIGYHAHNNFQLAFSNSIKFVSQDTRHDLVVDSTVYGMGKSAGNCPSELITLHLNEKHGKQYDVNQILEILDTDLMSIYQKHYWGYRYNFYISAMQNCHPEYVRYLLDQKTLSVSAVNEILAQIPEEKKLLYDGEYISAAYRRFQSKAIDDAAAVDALANAWEGKELLLLGPGRSILREKQKIADHIAQNNSIVIAVNFCPAGYGCDYVFVSNAKRYGRLMDEFGDHQTYKLIATSNITPYHDHVDYTFNYASLLEESHQQFDNALLLCLAALGKCGVRKATLAGFDGFSNESDYYDVSYSFAGNEAYKLQNNDKVRSGLQQLQEQIRVVFLTESLYQKGSVEA